MCRRGFTRPRFGFAANVSFIFDTGADCTVLMPTDAINMGIDFAHLANPSKSVGIGGSAQTYVEPARLAFADAQGDRAYAYNIPLLIHDQTDAAMKVPSLLGRDVIDRWRVTYDKSVQELSAQVLTSDAEFPA